MPLPCLSPDIDACAYLFLRELREVRDNGLVIVLDEASASPVGETVHVGSVAFPHSRPVEVRPESRSFELSWGTYVAYSVRNESFALWAESDRVSSGRLLRIYETSKFLDYVADTTWSAAAHPGPLIHVSIDCEHHVIDVAAVSLPKIVPLGA